MEHEGAGYPGCSFLCSLIWTSQFDLILESDVLQNDLKCQTPPTGAAPLTS